MNGQVIVGTGKAVGDPRHGGKPLQQPGRIPVGLAVLLQNAQPPVDRESCIAQGRAIAGPPFIEAVAVGDISHKADAARSGVDHAPNKLRLADEILHGDQIVAQQRLTRPGEAVHKDGGLAESADHFQIGPVEQLDAQDADGLLQVKMRGEKPRGDLSVRYLKHPDIVAEAADLIGEAGDKESTEVVAEQLAPCQQGDAPPGRLRTERLRIAQLPGLGEHQTPGRLRHRTPAVEDLGDGVSGQPAGVGDILHRYSFQRHQRSTAFIIQVSFIIA